jgi:hypothetical protein
VSSLATPSNLAAMDAVLNGRTVICDDEDTFRVGETWRAGERFRAGEVGSGVPDSLLVFSHDGGFCDGMPPMDRRLGVCAGEVGVSFGLRGELFGVDGRRLPGELCLMEPGLLKGDWRVLLKARGEGL